MNKIALSNTNLSRDSFEILLHTADRVTRERLLSVSDSEDAFRLTFSVDPALENDRYASSPSKAGSTSPRGSRCAECISPPIF